jgi:hypothetical protein
MKFSNYCKHLSQKVVLLCAIGMLLFNYSYAQKVTFLEVPVKLEVEKGDLDGVVVKVKKDGKDAFTQSGASKMRFKLDFDKKYSLIFTKDGYITKTIEFNTSVPAERINKGFEAYKIGVKLYKQGEDNNTVVYNQPVARIKYEQNIDEFNFDTDYSKSILSAIALINDNEKTSNLAKVPTASTNQESTTETAPPAPSPARTVNPEPTVIVQKEVEQSKETVKATETSKPSTVASADLKPIISGNQGLDQTKVEPVAEFKQATKSAPNSSGKDLKRIIKPSQRGEHTNQISTNAGKESQNRVLKSQAVQEQIKTTASSNLEMELTNNIGAFTEDEKITREDIIEKNRVIVKVTVAKGSKISEYSCVNYAWGGRFFFKDNKTSINENLFVQWTGIRP